MNVKNLEMDYKVRWDYKAILAKKGDYRPLSKITCRIWLKHKEQGPSTFITEGEATQNYKDPYNPFIGQRESLAKALKAHPFSKNERKNFWNAFLEGWDKVEKDNLPE